MSDAGVITEYEACGDGRLARVTLQNAKRANCLSTPLINDLRNAFLSLAEDDTLRVAVLTGAGERSFIAGADPS